MTSEAAVPGSPAPSGDPAHHAWASQQRRHVFWPVAGLVFASICALIAVRLVVDDLSTGSVVMAAVLALVPVVLVAATFLWLDRWEPEPGRILLFAFMWGAGVAVLGALIINTLVDGAYGEATSAVVSAPLAEEALKGAFLVGMLWLHRAQFDGLVDGVVYAGLVAAGFAFVENILYLGFAFDTSDSDGYLVFVMRGLLSPFAHPLFTVFIGVAVGLAARRHGLLVRLVLVLVGYALAVGVHAAWNASALWDDGRSFLSIYIFVMVPMFAGMAVLAMWQRRRERRVIAAHVASFADAGWVAPSEVQLLTTMRGRRHWRRVARAQSGADASRAVRDYQTAVTELAFIADRLAQGSVSPDIQERYTEVVGSVTAARAKAIAAAA